MIKIDKKIDKIDKKTFRQIDHEQYKYTMDPRW